MSPVSFVFKLEIDSKKPEVHVALETEENDYGQTNTPIENICYFQFYFSTY